MSYKSSNGTALLLEKSYTIKHFPLPSTIPSESKFVHDVYHDYDRLNKHIFTAIDRFKQKGSLF